MPEQTTKKRNAKGDGYYITNKDKTVTNRISYTGASGKRVIKNFRGKNKTEAKKLREKWEHDNGLNRHPDVLSSMGIAEYMHDWLDTYKKVSVAPTTYDAIEDCIESRVIGYEIERYQMGQINLSMMQSHINKLVEEGYSKATIIKTRNTLNNCFEKALLLGDVSVNPMTGIELPSERTIKTKKKKIQFYPPVDIDKIVAEVNKRYANGAPIYYHGAAIILMMFTGIRIGECMGLRWKCVDFDNSTIHIENSIIKIKNRDEEAKNKTAYLDSDPKSLSSNRTIPLSKKALEALQELYFRNEGYNGPEDYVVQSELHNMVSERNIRRCLHIIEDKADTSVKGAGMHVLRHTFASYMIYKGANIIALSKILGHSKPSVTTDIYVDIIDEQKTDAIGVLDK